MLRSVHPSAPITPLYPRGEGTAPEGRVLSVARGAMPSSPPRREEPSPALYIQIIDAMRPVVPQSPSRVLALDYGTFALGDELVTVPLSSASVRSPTSPPRSESSFLTALCESRACFWGFKVPGTLIVIGGMSFLIYYTSCLAENDSKFLMTPIVIGIVNCMIVWVAFTKCLKYAKRNTVVPAPHTA